MAEELLNDANNDSIATYLQQSYHEISDGVYKILFSLNSIQGSSRYLSQLSCIVQTIQMIGILFTLNGSVTVIPWSQIHARPVISFCSIFSEQGFNSLGASQVSFQIALSLVGLLLGGGVGIALLMKHNNQIPILLELYSVLANLLFSIILVPIIRVLVLQILSDNALNQFLGVIAFIPMMVLNICYISAVFDTNPLSKSASARSQTRVDVLYAISKILVVIVSVSTTNAFILSITAFVLSVSVSYLLTMYLPYYDCRMMQYQAACSWIFSWASLSAIVASVYNNDSSGGAVFMFVGGIPVVVLSSYLIIQGRFEHLRAVPITELKNPWEVQIRFRIALQDVDQTAMKTALLKQHQIRAKVDRENLVDKEDVVIELNAGDKPQKGDHHAEMMDFHECKSIIVTSLTRFPDSIHLLLAAATFHIDIARIYFLAYMYLDQVSVLNPKADERFLLYRIQRTIEDRIFESESNSEIIQYNTQRDLLERAQNLDLRIVQATIDFWTEALKSKPDDDRMRELAVQISNESKTAYSSYSKGMGISDDSVTALQSYSGFLLTILRDIRSGERLLERAKELQQAKTKLKQTSVFKDLLFDDRAAVVLISGNIRNLGVILDCNLRAAQLLGFSKSILVGKNSRIFLPEPFASNHDGLLLRNLQQGVQKLIDGKNNLVILHQNGYIQDVNLFVKSFIKDLSTLCFIGVVESINPDSLIIIYDRSGVVTAISQTVSLQFGIEKDRVDSHDIHIQDIIPDIESQHAAYRKAIASNPDYVRLISLERDGIKFQISIRFQTWSLLNDDIAVTVRIDILGKQAIDDPDSPFHKPGMNLEDIPVSVSGTADQSDTQRHSQSDGSQAHSNWQSSESETETDDGPALSHLAVDHVAALDHDPSSVVDHALADSEDPGRELSRIVNDNLEPTEPKVPALAVAVSDSGPSPDHDAAGSNEQDIQPFYPNMTPTEQKKPKSKAQGSKSRNSGQSRSKGKSQKDRSSDESPSRTSNATSQAAADNDTTNDAVQKRLEQTLMKWLHRAFISVFFMLAVLSLGQVFVAQQIVADFMAAIGTSNFSGEYALDYLRIADSVRVTDLVSQGLISDPDHSLVAKHFATIQKFAVIASICRNSLLAGRLGWDEAVMNEYSSTFPISFCTKSFTSGCNFQITTLVAFDMFNQLSKEIASVPVDRLDLIDANSIRFIIDNVSPLTEISNKVAGFGASAAKEQNRLIRLADLADLVLQIAAATFLFLYAVRATIIGVQLRNDHALITVFHVPNSSVNNIITPYSDRLAILQRTETIDSSENQDARTEASFNVFGTLTKEKNSDSSKQKRLKRIESQIRKTSKFKTRRLLRYFLKFGQLVVLYTFFFTYRHVGILSQAHSRAPLPVRFQFGWRSAALLRRALFNTRELLLVSADMLLSHDAVNNTAGLHASIDADIAMSEIQRRALIFGGDLGGDYYPGYLTAGNGHFELEFSDVCFIPDVATAAPDCGTFSNGLARNGRQALLAELVRLIPQIITDMDSLIKNIRSDPSFAPGIQARNDFLRAQLQSHDLNLALKIDNNFNGNTARYFAHLLTVDRAQLAVERLDLGYTLIAMVIIINIYGYLGVVMSALRDIAREFTQTQDLLKFVPVEIREMISKDLHKKSKNDDRSTRSISLLSKAPLAVLRQLRRSPLLSTALFLGISAICLTFFTDPSSIWKSLTSNPLAAFGAACDSIISSWTPFGFGFILTNINFDTTAEEVRVALATHFGQMTALCMATLMNGILGQPIEWNMALFGTIGSILGNIFSYFLVDGVFDRDLVNLVTFALFITYSLTMGIAQRYLSAKMFKKVQNITGMDHVDVLLFGALSGAFSYLNGSSCGALFFFMVDCYFQLHFSIALPTSILVGAVNSLFLLGFHQLLDIPYVDFSDTDLLNVILPIVFISTPVLCYFSVRSQGRYFKEYMVIISIAFGVFIAASARGVGTWIYIYVFICALVLWLPVCASTAVGGTIRSAAFEDV